MSLVESLAARQERSRLYTYSDDPTRFRWVGSNAPLHYHDGSAWQTIDLTPERIQTSAFDGWQTTQAGWHYRLGQPQGGADGWIGFGARRGASWLGFRLARVGYLRWNTRAWQDIGGAPTYDRRNLTNTPRYTSAGGELLATASEVTWGGIWSTPGGGDLSLNFLLNGERLKEDIVINQAGREWIAANRPPTTPASQTWFGFVFQLDWTNIPRVVLNGLLQDVEGGWDGSEPVELRDAADALLALLPLASLTVQSGGAVLAETPLRRRFWRDPDGNYYLLIGVRVNVLAGLPAGDLHFDPTIQAGPGAGADDGHYRTDGSYNNNFSNASIGAFSSTVDSGAFIRVPGLTLDPGVTINQAYFTFEAHSTMSGSPCNVLITLNDVDDATAPADNSACINAVRTTASGAWNDIEAWTDNSNYDSADFSAALQEVIDRAGWSSGNAICVYFDNNGSASGAQRQFRTYNGSPAPVLTVEYTAGGSTTNQSVGGTLSLSGVVAALKTVVSSLSGALSFLGLGDPEPSPARTLYRINCGGPALAGWDDDAGYYTTAGSVESTTTAQDTSLVPGVLPEVLQTHRWTLPEEGDVIYTFDVTGESLVTVKLYFSEIFATFTKPGDRVMDIYVDGVLKANNFDPYVAAGNAQHKGSKLEYTVTPAGTTLEVRAVRVVHAPMFSAILVQRPPVTEKILAGALSFGGVVGRAALFVKSLGGGIAFSGVPALIKSFLRSFGGELIPGGSLSRVVSSLRAGALALSGAISGFLQGSQQFEINHEDGTLGEYASLVDSADLSVTAEAALGGTDYGLAVDIDETASYGVYELASPVAATTVRARFYVDPNSATFSTGGLVFLLSVYPNTGMYALGYVWLRHDGTSFELCPVAVTDAPSNLVGGYYDITDAPHYCEIQWTRASSDVAADGTMDFWVDGVHQGTTTDIDNWDIWGGSSSELSFLRFGQAFQSGTLSGTFYVDELVINNTGNEIGPLEQLYQQVVGGVLALAGAISRLSVRAFSGVLGLAGGLSALPNKVLGGSLGLAGQASRLIAVTRAGVLSAAGSLSASVTRVLQLGGSLNFSSLLSRVIASTQDGSLSFVGDVYKASTRLLSGEVSFGGAVDVILGKLMQVGGALNLSGTVSRLNSLSRTLGGALDFAGGLTRQAAVSLAGSLGLGGTLDRVTAFLRSLGGEVSFSSVLDRLYQSGAQTYYQVVGGALNLASQLQRDINLALAGALGLGGQVYKASSQVLAGALDFAGSVVQVSGLGQVLGGVVSFAGDLERETRKTLVGVIGPGGTLGRQVSVIRTGVLNLEASLVRQTNRFLSGALDLAGAVERTLGGVIEALVTELQGSFIVSSALAGLYRLRTALLGHFAILDNLLGVFWPATDLVGTDETASDLAGQLILGSELTGAFIVQHSLVGVYAIATSLGGSLMTSENQNFEMYSGDTHHLDITVRDADGALMDLTGATIEWGLYDQDGTVLVSKSTGSGITLTDPVNGVFRVTISPADTESLGGIYRHEAQVTDLADQVATVTRGRATIKPDIVPAS